MNHTAIDLSAYRPVSAPVPFDYAAYERRAAGRFRVARICQIAVSAVDILVSLTIGLCIVIGTAAFVQMLP